MDFNGDDTQAERGRTFAGEEVAASVVSREREARWDAALFRRMGEAGLLGAGIPVEDGGGGLGAAAVCDLLRGFGEGAADAGLALAWGMHAFGCALPIAIFGDRAQRRRYLPGLCRGEAVGALAHAEDSAAGDRLGIGARATRRGSRWVLTGTKTWIVNGPVADVLVVTAVTDLGRGKDGVSAFLVEKGTPGLEIGRPIETSGLRSASIADLTLAGCEIPEESLLGAQGAGLTRVHGLARRWDRTALVAPWLGAMRALLDRSVACARERHDLGRPIASSQSIRARLAEMKIRYELCRRLQARAAWLLDLDDGAADAERDLAIARLFITESLAFMTRDARSIFGARGDPLADRLARDAAVFEQMGGGSDRLRAVIAGALLDLG